MIIGALWTGQAAVFLAGWLGPWRDAPEQGTNGRVPRPLRMLLSLSLVITAFGIRWSSPPALATYSQLVLLGMTASFIGDLIMARLIVVPNRLVGGMAAFGLAHALYITAYARTIERAGAPLANPGLYLGLVLYGVATVSGWWLFIRNPRKEFIVNAGALIYGSWIAIMASFALALAAVLGGAWWMTAFGGLIFVVSDFLIGMTDIRGLSLKNANDWIWLTYVVGQMGIIYAAWIPTVVHSGG